MSRAAAAIGATLALLAAACGAAGGAQADAHVTVFAASSLTDAFGAEAAAYRSAHPDATVTFSFGASSDLATQVQQGAPADVIATASTTTMDVVTKQLTSPALTFARNKLVIVTERGNPKHIESLADLGRAGVAVVLAAEGVPAGDYARQALSDAHVTVHPKSLETDVRGVLTKVELGEADAGIVYVTDAKSAHGKVSSVPIPSAPTATYPIAALDAKGKPFVDFVRSPPGQAILANFGFLPP